MQVKLQNTKVKSGKAWFYVDQAFMPGLHKWQRREEGCRIADTVRTVRMNHTFAF
jgi:hypothetical protein